MHRRQIALGLCMLLPIGLGLGCGEAPRQQRPQTSVTDPTDRPDPADAPEERGMPGAGTYETHTSAALVASVQRAVGDRDYLGLIKLMTADARYELCKNAKDWFFTAIRLMPGTEQKLLEVKGLTRGQFNLMDDEYYTAYEMWHGRLHQELIAELSDRLLAVDEVGDGATASFGPPPGGSFHVISFALERTDRGWRIAVPGAISRVSAPTTAPASQPASTRAADGNGE